MSLSKPVRVPVMVVAMVMMMVVFVMSTPVAWEETEEQHWSDGSIKRSDDTNALQNVVDRLTQKLAQLEAQVQANRNDLDAAVGQMVEFSLRMRTWDVHGLALHQVVRFDNVLFNAGNGYSADTGVFTTPVSGSYVFFLQVMHHNNDDAKIMLDILKNGTFLARAHAGFTPFENGSTMVLTHLRAGDTIRVEIGPEGSQFWGGEFTTFTGFRVSSH